MADTINFGDVKEKTPVYSAAGMDEIIKDINTTISETSETFKKSIQILNTTDGIISSKLDQLSAEVEEKHTIEEPLFSFATFSDLHLLTKSGGNTQNDDGGHDDLVRAFGILKNRIEDKNLNLKYIGVTGDIGYSSNSSELSTFNRIAAAHCPIPLANIFACNGNHDQMHTAQEWREMMFDESIWDKVTDDKNYSFTDGDFTFACMSLAQQSDNSGCATDGRICYLTDSTKNWLSGIIDDSTGKTLMLFMHFPFTNRQCADTQTSVINEYQWETGETITAEVAVAQLAAPYAGLIDRGGNGTSYNYAFSPANHGFYIASGVQDYSVKNECEQIIDMLKEHNGPVIVFSGHTHLVFQTEEFSYATGKGYPNINVAQIPDTQITTVHIPSLNYPRKLTCSSIGTISGWDTISGSNRYRQQAQFWIVDVFNDKLVLKAVESNTCHDKIYGDDLKDYIYTIDLQK